MSERKRGKPIHTWVCWSDTGECVAVCRSVLQCVAVCCSVLQCVAYTPGYAGQTRGRQFAHCLRLYTATTLQSTQSAKERYSANSHCNTLEYAL